MTAGSNISEVKTTTACSNESAVSLLKQYLASAEKGEIVSVGLCAVMTEGAYRYGFGGGVDLLSLLGSADMLKETIRDSLGEAEDIAL